MLFSSVTPPQRAAACELAQAQAHHFVLDAWSGAAITTPLFDVNADGVVNTHDAVNLPAGQGVAAVLSTDPVMGPVLGAQAGLVLAGSSSAASAASTPICRPDPLGKCPPHHCLVALTRADAAHIELCLPDRCARSPEAEGCRDKVILDRLWRPLLNPPVF